MPQWNSFTLFTARPECAATHLLQLLQIPDTPLLIFVFVVVALLLCNTYMSSCNRCNMSRPLNATTRCQEFTLKMAAFANFCGDVWIKRGLNAVQSMRYVADSVQKKHDSDTGGSYSLMCFGFPAPELTSPRKLNSANASETLWVT